MSTEKAVDLQFVAPHVMQIRMQDRVSKNTFSEAITQGLMDAFAEVERQPDCKVVILTGFLQTRQAQKRTPVANKQMGLVMRILVTFFGLISLQFPSGLVLYFFVSNLWRLGQQEVIFRRFGSATTTGRKEAIDVASKDRTGGKTATAVKELDAAEDDEDVLDVDEASTRKPPPSRARSGPPAGGGPAKSEPAATSPTSTGAKPKGLRGMFALPPPPEGNGGGSTAKGKSTPSSRSSTPSSPPPQRRRSNKKKKRKR